MKLFYFRNKGKEKKKNKDEKKIMFIICIEYDTTKPILF